MNLKNLLEYKYWTEVNQILGKGLSEEVLKEVFCKLQKKIFDECEEVLYINLGIISNMVKEIYKLKTTIFQPDDFDKTLKFEDLKNIKDLKRQLLKNQLDILFDLVEKGGKYWYELVGEQKFEIAPEQGNIFDELELEGILPKQQKEEAKNLWKNYWCEYLTIHYGMVFVCDSLLIFEKEKIDEDTWSQFIIWYKAALQYLAGYLMHQVSRIHALRSAVAAIMARNLSHNIGSHVQHYLSKEDYFENPDDFWITKGV